MSATAADTILMYLDDLRGSETGLVPTNAETLQLGIFELCKDGSINNYFASDKRTFIGFIMGDIYNNYRASDQQPNFGLTMGASQPVRTLLFVIENTL